jgi:UDP-N-acetylmuramoylalanine-D-glutamate ligase
VGLLSVHSRHGEVEQYAADLFVVATKEGEPFVAVPRGDDPEPRSLQQDTAHLSRVLFVVDQQERADASKREGGGGART